MALGWQDLLAGFIVAIAAAYLLRTALGILRRKSTAGCGQGCQSCTSDTVNKTLSLVTLEARRGREKNEAG